ncbi:MAG: type secretion integral inner rane protein [Chlamydiia bacterium]|nr:type secretion integral inner rane protein [Chlamydiia bacterium]
MKSLFSILTLMCCCFVLFSSAMPLQAAVPVIPTTQPEAPQPAQPAPRTLSAKKGAAVTPPKDIYDLGGMGRPSMITQTVAIVFMSMLPFIVMILSSFVKIVVVLSLLRNALGVQQAPPNQVINGIALLLSIYVMFPTGVKMYDAGKQVLASKSTPQELFSNDSAAYIIEIGKAAREPLRDFLRNNSLVKHHRSFFKTVYRLLPDDYKDDLKPDDFLVLVPSFITSQLKSAFEIGVLIYIPFFVIDLVVSNILLAMGMMMLSPVTISMPLKLFLLVMLDGWTLLIEGLVATFR